MSVLPDDLLLMPHTTGDSELYAVLIAFPLSDMSIVVSLLTCKISGCVGGAG